MQLRKLVVLAPVVLSVVACSREGKDRRLPDGVVGQKIVTGGASPATQIVDEGQFAAWTGSVSFLQATEGDPTLLAWDFDDDGSNDQILCDESGGGAPSCQTSYCTFGPYAFSSVPVENPHGLLLVDLNNDARRDVVSANSSDVVVALNESASGAISFGASSTFSGVGSTYGVAAADLNADGLRDLAIVGRFNSTASLLRNTTVGMTPTFAAKQDFSLPTGPRDQSPAIADLDGDGKPDLLVPTQSAVTIFMNTTVNFATDFTFSAPTDFLLPFCAPQSSVELGNLNGDGRVDFVVTNQCGGFSVFMNSTTSATPAFTRSDFFGAVARDLATADLNASNFADLALASSDTAGNAALLAMINTTPLNGMSASFAPSVSFPLTGGNLRNLDVGDLGGDSKPDVAGVFRRQDPGGVVLEFINTTTTGSLTPSFTLTQQPAPPVVNARDVAIADLDGDGLRDIAVADAGENNIDILRSFGGQGWSCPVNVADFQNDSKGAGSGPTASHSSRLNLSKTAGAAFTQLRDVTVQNIPPFIFDLNVIPVIAEGDFAAAQVFWSDPGVNDAFVLEIDWGDGFISSVPRPIGFNAGEAIHRYPNAGTYGLSATVRDDEAGGVSFPVFATITVLDTPPVIGSVTTNAPISAGSAASVTVNLTNPNGDFFLYDFDWNGDGDFVDAGIDITDSASSTTFFTENFGVSRTVNVRAKDDDGNVVTGSVDVAWTNRAPQAVADGGAAFTTTEDAAFTVSQATLLGNDTDADTGDTKSLVSVAAGANGTVAISGPVNVVFTPSPNFNGTGTFTYTMRDAAGATSTATVSVSVTAVNDPPIASGDTLTTDEDQAVSTAATNLLVNDSDVDSALAVTAAGAPQTNGTATILSGVVTFTPTANFNGIGTFTYIVSDGTSSVTATVTVNVVAVNDPPVAVNDAKSTGEDTPLTFLATDLSGNDTDVDTGDTRTVASVGTPNNGTATLSGANVTYTPAANFTGTDTFTYTVQDIAGATATGVVTVTITAVNDLPVAAADARATSEDAALVIASSTLLSNDSDVDGPVALSVTAVSNPLNGTVSLSAPGGVITFTPAANFNGNGASFDYTVSDSLATALATVTVAVAAVNDAPVAVDDAKSTGEDTPITFPATDLSGNDTDVDTGDTRSVAAVGTPNNGTATLSGGNVTYTPAANFPGPTDTFTYVVRDVAGATATGVVTVTVTAVNDVPAITAIGTQSATEGLLFQFQATTTGGVVSPLTWSLAVFPSGMTISAAGTLTWVPTYFQSDDLATPMAHTVTVQLLDGDGGAAVSATFTVNATYLDADGDGMADTWEVGNGLDPTVNDATGDADGDGIRNLDEYRADNQGYIPPGQVSAVSPLDGQQSLVQDPVLDFTDAAAGSASLAARPYQLQVFDEGMVNVVLDTELNGPPGPNLNVSTIVLDDTTVANDAGNPSNVDLTDDDVYAWRVRAIDTGGGRGLWSVPVRFQYSPTNDPPTAPLHQAPVAGEVVGILRPELVVSNSTDPDALTPLMYDFEVYANATCTGATVATSPDTPQGAGGTTKFVLATDLADDTVHCWRVFADDGPNQVSSGNRTFTVNTANNEPGFPTLNSPADGSDVSTATVTLIAGNATDADGDTLEYWFELDTTPTFAGPDYQVSQAVPEGATTTSFLTGALVEDATYWWRVRASDGYSLGDWALGTFFVSTADDAPTAPVALNPIDGTTVNNVAPELSVQNAMDPEGDAVTYGFEVRAGAVDGEIVASATGVAEGTGGRTSWTVDPPLEKGVIYFWTASATSGALSTSIAAPESFFTYKVPKVASGCSVGGVAGPMAGSLVGFLALAGILVRRRKLS